MDAHHLPQLLRPKMALQWMKNVVCWFYNENSSPFVSFSLLRNAWNWIHVDLWVVKKFEWSFSFRFRTCRWRRRMFSYCMAKHDVKSIHSIRFSSNFPFSRTTAKTKLSDIVKAHYCWEFTSHRSVGKNLFFGPRGEEDWIWIDQQHHAQGTEMCAVHKELTVGNDTIWIIEYFLSESISYISLHYLSTVKDSDMWRSLSSDSRKQFESF